MSAPIEDRLRAHFADRCATEPLPMHDYGLPLRPVKRQRHRPVLVAAAAAGLVVLAVAAAIAVVNGGRERRDVAAPGAPTVTSVVVGVQGILGGWDGVQWVAADDPTVQQVALVGGETYWILGLDRAPTRATGSEPRFACRTEGHLGDDVERVDVPGLERPADPLAAMPIAVTGVTDPLPRPTIAVAPESGPYREIAVAALAQYGVTDPDPPLVQLYRTDFEGNGVDEVLIAAERLSDPIGLQPAEGDYSVLLVQRRVDGNPVTELVSGWKFSGGPGLNVARFSAVADLNGDGVMEVVTDARFDDGTATGVATVGETIDGVLGVWCSG